MSDMLPSATRRGVLAASAAAGAASLLPAQASAAADSTAIRPFHIKTSNQALIDLRKRIAATRFPERETVADATQGLQLATVRKLAQYWSTEYDWRKCEAKLNALPNFITEIDGLDIHFIHLRSPHANALPLIMTHGWLGSFLEFVKGDRATKRSRVPWSSRGGGVRSRRALNARFRLLSQAAGDRLESRTSVSGHPPS
jgi:hypothetical protein